MSCYVMFVLFQGFPRIEERMLRMVLMGEVVLALRSLTQAETRWWAPPGDKFVYGRYILTIDGGPLKWWYFSIIHLQGSFSPCKRAILGIPSWKLPDRSLPRPGGVALPRPIQTLCPSWISRATWIRSWRVGAPFVNPNLWEMG